ncbi:MAG: SUMF1/EgtB/PvdO family nonheme iron enzyme [Chitinivibrionia bacterium]|nr:SUMF1/EgtB/PvdO family nonheme iron enzyme [Chitinivibrionia bacterium]
MKISDLSKVILAAVVGMLTVFSLLFVAGCGDNGKQDTWDNGSYGGGNYEYKQNKPLTFSATIRTIDGTQRTINGTLEKGKYLPEQWAINMGWSAEYQGQAQTLQIESVGDFPKEILDAYDNGAGNPVGVTFMIRSLDRFNDEGATPIASFYPSFRGVRGDFLEVEISDAELLCLANKFTAAFEAAAKAANLNSCPVVLNVAYEEDIAVVSGYMRTVTFDSQGGESVSSITQRQGTVITLSTLTRNDFTFQGWYTSSSGGTKYDNPYVISDDVTMYAQWVESSTINKDTIINGIECVLVKAGSFTMGVGADPNYIWWSPVTQQVTLTQDFWISKYPITQAQYSSVMGNNPSSFSGNNNPVESVTWYNANDFAQAVGGRLPTEAEWEFAARSGNKSQGYIYSGSNNLNEVGWYWNNSDGTRPVGQKLPNELGIYDMSGNVWEWCSDFSDGATNSGYSSGGVTNPTGPSSGDFRVVRGGSWRYDAQYCRVAYHNFSNPTDNYAYFGFRVVFPRN